MYICVCEIIQLIIMEGKKKRKIDHVDRKYIDLGLDMGTNVVNMKNVSIR